MEESGKLDLIHGTEKVEYRRQFKLKHRGEAFDFLFLFFFMMTNANASRKTLKHKRKILVYCHSCNIC